MSDSDKTEVNKVHEVAQRDARLDQDIAVKSIMTGEDIANAYMRKGTGTQQAALNNATDSENNSKKAADFLLYLDMIEKLEAAARENLENMRQIQADMGDILADMDDAVQGVKVQQRNLHDYLDAYRNRDVEAMEHFMLASGLYIQEEIDAMFQDGSAVAFIHEYENFLQDAINNYDPLEVLQGFNEQYEAKKNELDQERKSLNERIDQLRAAGKDDLAKDLEHERDGLDQKQVELDQTFGQKVLDLKSLMPPEHFREAFKQLRNNVDHNTDFVRVSHEHIVQLDKPLTNQYNIASGATELNAPDSEIEQEISKPVETAPGPGFGGF